MVADDSVLLGGKVALVVEVDQLCVYAGFDAGPAPDAVDLDRALPGEQHVVGLDPPQGQEFAGGLDAGFGQPEQKDPNFRLLEIGGLAGPLPDFNGQGGLQQGIMQLNGLPDATPHLPNLQAHRQQNGLPNRFHSKLLLPILDILLRVVLGDQHHSPARGQGQLPEQGVREVGRGGAHDAVVENIYIMLFAKVPLHYSLEHFWRTVHGADFGCDLIHAGHSCAR